MVHKNNTDVKSNMDLAGYTVKVKCQCISYYIIDALKSVAGPPKRTCTLIVLNGLYHPHPPTPQPPL
jgi:hypothetical protein